MEVFCFVKKKNESTIKSVKNLLRNKTKQNKKPKKTNKQTNKRIFSGTSLVVQWLRIRLPVQETQAPSLVRDDPTCCAP